jgi:selenium-binding protein 1
MRLSLSLVPGVLLAGCIVGEPDQDPSTIANHQAVDFHSIIRKPTVKQEQLLYVVAVEKTEAGAQPSPDALFVVDVKPGSSTYGQIINRVDMPNVGDELHHFGYNWDNTRLEVDGLFSGRVYIYDVKTDAKHPHLVAENDNLMGDSGYGVPHTVIALPNGNNLVSMIGSNTFGFPGGLIQVDAQTGQFDSYFGAGPDRDYETVGPKYMYDAGFKPELNRMITTTFGKPADVAGFINVPGLGNEVYVWDLLQRKVIQKADLGANCGALEVRWTNTFGEPVGYTNCPGTGSIWMWEDYNHDGVYSFHQFLAGQIGVPADIVMTLDSKYIYIADWIGGHVYQVNIQNRMNPTITATVAVPYAQMMRLSQDGKRLYVTNSILSPWDEDPALGGPRNVDYGLFELKTGDPGLTFAPGGNPLVDFTHIHKANGSIGRMRPHQVFFDPAVVWPAGFH